MPSSSRSRSPISPTVAIVAITAVAGALFAITQVSSGDSSNSVELASKNRTKASCPAPTSDNVNARSKVGTYIDTRGAVQHHGDGQEPFRPPSCVEAAPAAGNTVAADGRRR